MVGANNNLNAGKLSKANNNADTDNAHTNHNASKLGEAAKNTKKNLDTGKLGKANKNINMEHDVSRVNNISDANEANNVKKEAKVYEIYLFSLLLIIIEVEKQDCKIISLKPCLSRHRILFSVLLLLSRNTVI